MTTVPTMTLVTLVSCIHVLSSRKIAMDMILRDDNSPKQDGSSMSIDQPMMDWSAITSEANTDVTSIQLSWRSTR
jgi:hypothetical protein